MIHFTDTEGAAPATRQPVALCAAWQEHLLSTLSKRPTVQLNVFADLMRWGSTALSFVLVALVATFIVLPTLNLKLLPPHAALHARLDALAASLHLGDITVLRSEPPEAAGASGPAAASSESMRRGWAPPGNHAEGEWCPGSRGECADADADADAASSRCPSRRNCSGGAAGAAALGEEIGSGSQIAGSVGGRESRGEGGLALEQAVAPSVADSGGEMDQREDVLEGAEDATDEDDGAIELQLLEVVRRERRLLEAVMRRRQRAKATVVGEPHAACHGAAAGRAEDRGTCDGSRHLLQY